MATDSNQLHKPSPESVRAGYELSTVSVRALVYFVIGLVLTAALIHAGIWFLLMGYYNLYVGGMKPGSALTETGLLKHANVAKTAAELPGPPPPRLQPSQPENDVPAGDLQHMMEGQDNVFQRMGWTIDKETHVPLRIPSAAIEQVMREERQHAVGATRQAPTSQQGRH